MEIIKIKKPTTITKAFDDAITEYLYKNPNEEGSIKNIQLKAINFKSFEGYSQDLEIVFEIKDGEI